MSIRVPILTVSPEELMQVSRTWAHNPFLSQLTGKIGEQATLIDPGNSHTIDHIVSIEYASYMMVPPATNKTSWTISIHTNEQSVFTTENGHILESKTIVLKHLI